MVTCKLLSINSLTGFPAKVFTTQESQIRYMRKKKSKKEKGKRKKRGKERKEKKERREVLWKDNKDRVCIRTGKHKRNENECNESDGNMPLAIRFIVFCCFEHHFYGKK